MSDNEDWTPDGKRRKIIVKKTPEQLMRQKIRDSSLPSKVKKEAYNRLEHNDKEKTLEWIEHLLKIPYNKYVSLPVDKLTPEDKMTKYFEKVSSTLNDAVYGMNNAKEEVLNYIAQFISTNSNTMPRILGLQGSAGTGKTSLVRRGFAKALNRPIQCISMGGSRDSNYFLGHDFTYVGSRYGMITQCLIQLGCMNGIIFMDEVDKISNSSDGIEIQNMLLHVTDPVQNNTFQDKYFAGIDIDLSKIIFVFSFNHEAAIDPILRDRIHIIRIADPSLNEKIVIGSKYLLKEVQTNIGFKAGDVCIPDEICDYIIKHYTKLSDKGVRGLKKCIESILLKLNTARYIGTSLQKYKCLKNKIKFPLTVSRDMVDELLRDSKPEEDKYLTTMYL